MIAFEVRVNDEVVCTAGIEDCGVLTSMLTWVRRRPPESADDEPLEEELTLEVGALDNRAPQPSEHLKWLSQPLRVGDCVSMRIVDVGTADPPLERRVDDPAAVDRAKRRYYEQLKRQYESDEKR